MNATFLQAEWRKLVMINYIVDPVFLQKYLPYKTEIDTWQGKCYISLVGFMFLDTKVKGFKIPFHINFEEVNLRFYVRYNDNGENKRGVVFIKEIVPKPMLALVANTIYKENYVALPMNHSWIDFDESITVEYSWKKEKWNIIKVIAGKEVFTITDGSEEEFITEHYWGYTKINDAKTSEYNVVHPKWVIYPTIDYLIEVDFEKTYGENFKFLETQNPQSVLLAEGSEVSVKSGKVI